MEKAIETIGLFQSQKYENLSEISVKHPTLKTWGSRYYHTQTGQQCSLPRIHLSFRGLISAPCWQQTEKQNLIEAVQSFNGRVIDWKEIAERSKLGKKKTPRECMMMYRNSLDPSINHREWTEEEKIKLHAAVRTYQEHDWCSISDAVGNGRTPLQCIEYYQVRLNLNAINNNEWSPEEDEILKQAVELYGVKNWQHVANCLPGRAANQCHARWRLESRTETIRSGKWSDLEERRLILAVLAYGEKNLSRPSQSSSQATLPEDMTTVGVDPIPVPVPTTSSSASRPKRGQGLDQRIWMKISHHVPGRDEVKCREKWLNVMDPQINNQPFSSEEDFIILRETSSIPSTTEEGEREDPPENSTQIEPDIYSVGANWSAIASLLPGRTDNQVWRRWKELNGKINACVYTELSKKRKAVVPTLRSRAKATKVDPRNYKLVLTLPSENSAQL